MTGRGTPDHPLPNARAEPNLSCEFCEVVNGGGETPVIAREAEWIAFLPLQPATPGHTLVVPQQHVADFWEAGPELVQVLAVAARRVGRAIQRAVEPEGLNLMTSAGHAAEQTIFHLHLHLVPRWESDAIGAIWPASGVSESTDEAMAERIRSALAAQPR